MNIVQSITLGATILLLCCCGNSSSEKTSSTVAFPMVEPPVVMDSPVEISSYMASHYWDRFTDKSFEGVNDSLRINSVLKTELEQKFADWLYLLDGADIATARKAVVNFHDKVAACQRRDSLCCIYAFAKDMVRKYLYDPNSPVRNEDLYGVYAECLSKSDLIDESLKDSYAFESRMCSLNRIGEVAADFRFSDIGGHIRTMHSVKSEWTLLFFSNPGCHACGEIIDQLKNLEFLPEMISSGYLSVINIYIDQDLDEWKSYMEIYPKEWINCYDPDYVIRTDTLYNIRAIPSLYLLDAQKRVVLKDATPERVIMFLNNLLHE